MQLFFEALHWYLLIYSSIFCFPPLHDSLSRLHPQKHKEGKKNTKSHPHSAAHKMSLYMFFALLVSLSFFCSSILICRCAHVSLASFSESPNSLALAAHCLFSCHTLHLPCDDAMPSDSSISRSTRPFTFWHQLSLTLWLLIQIEKFQLVDYW